jgi:hypothetical protein
MEGHGAEEHGTWTAGPWTTDGGKGGKAGSTEGNSFPHIPSMFPRSLLIRARPRHEKRETYG